MPPSVLIAALHSPQTGIVDYGRVYSEGWGDFVTTDFKDLTGHEARSFKQFATDFAPASSATS